MSGQVHGLLLSGSDLLLLNRLILLVEQNARRNGIPAPAECVRLKRDVETAIAAERTLIGHQLPPQGHRYVTTTEYAKSRGISDRQARRYAKDPRSHATLRDGRWLIPIRE